MGFGRGDFRKPEFKKISDYIWEIDPSFKQGMRADIIIGSERFADVKPRKVKIRESILGFQH
ncbi:MAG TPA: hypothetical protein VJH24_06070 [Candidatus Bilamarchaeaceae archaeon]|nr:hypothetical protein [Candidatus Bilamarchaeaceae archaeon]